MKTINEILQDYTSGKTPLAETNAALAEAEAGYYLVPGKNDLTEQEIADTRLGYVPGGTNGWGLLDTGTGSLDKVEIRNGKLVGTNIGSMRGLVIVAGHTYEVQGDTLVEESGEDTPWWAPYHTFTGAVAWQDELPQYIPEKEMFYDRARYHGVEVVKGCLRYIYAEDGSCKYQPKSMKDYDEDHGRA